MRRRFSQWVVLSVAGLALLAGTGAQADDKAEAEQNKRDAVQRVADAHDEVLITGAARLIVKQFSIRIARGLLTDWGKEDGLGAGWKSGTPEFDQAERRLIELATVRPLAQLAQNAWVKDIRAEYVANTFDGESADTIATHFESKSGKAQIAFMDWFMGEMTLFNYTYTGRFQYDLKGAEQELKELQRAAQPRIPKKDNELEFSSLNPEAFQFVACSPDSRYCPGVRYARMNAISVQGAILRHIDAVGLEIQDAMRGLRGEVQPMIDQFRSKG